jgi:outer membrane autotransporter protein
MGADAAVADNARVGVMAGYSRASFNASDRASSGKSDSYSLGLYGGARWGALALRAGAAYTWQDVSTRRSVAFESFTDQLQAKTRASATQAFAELGYTLQAGGATVEPFVNLSHVRLSSNAFAEQGGAAALKGAGASASTSFSTVGAHATTAVELGQTQAQARLTLGWRHAFGNAAPATTLQFVSGGDAFTVAGTPIAKNAAVVQAGLDMAISKNATLGVSYNGQISAKAKDHGASANLKVRF